MKDDYDLTNFKPGFRGHDSMREKAERMLRGEIEAERACKIPSSMSSPKKTKMRHYARGGRIPTDLHIPRRRKSDEYALGGFLSNLGRNIGSLASRAGSTIGGLASQAGRGIRGGLSNVLQDADRALQIRGLQTRGKDTPFGRVASKLGTSEQDVYQEGRNLIGRMQRGLHGGNMPALSAERYRAKEPEQQSPLRQAAGRAARTLGEFGKDVLRQGPTAALASRGFHYAPKGYTNIGGQMYREVPVEQYSARGGKVGEFFEELGGKIQRKAGRAKQRLERFGQRVKSGAERVGRDIEEGGRRFLESASPIAKRVGKRLLHEAATRGREVAKDVGRGLIEDIQEGRGPKGISRRAEQRLRESGRKHASRFGRSGLEGAYELAEGMGRAAKPHLEKVGTSAMREAESLTPRRARGVLHAAGRLGKEAYERAGAAGSRFGEGLREDISEGRGFRETAGRSAQRARELSEKHGSRLGRSAKEELSKAKFARGGVLPWHIDLRGERPIRKACREGGSAYAMGGVGKIRHGQATHSGMPISRRRRTHR